MPLAPPVLLAGLVDIFNNPFNSEAEAAQAWANAFKKYMTPLAIPPPTNPQRHALAAKAMQAALVGMSAPGAGVVTLQKGFTVYAATVALNSAPISVPPPAPLILPAFPPTSDPVSVASAITTAVSTWIITGTFTIPPAPPIPWA